MRYDVANPAGNILMDMKKKGRKKYTNQRERVPYIVNCL